ncbi:MFS transporter [Cuniculiplasma sp. SKW3]|uniref:MFS transporter n=1 Tax=Cuniculiplasma sp. SKW3 TaxID=3400170 RepID=UPI003FD1AD1A
MRNKLGKETFFQLSILSFIQFLRLSGVFLVIPVLALYATKFTSSGILVGISLAAYEISMAIMQIPSGRLSDKYGRINLIRMGLLIFLAGNLFSWYASNIYELIISRFIAGLGAVSAPITALSQEIVPSDRKNTAMAIVGSGIGAAFMLGTALSPLIGYFIHIRNIFLISSLFALVGIIMVSYVSDKGIKRSSQRFHINEATLLLSLGSLLFSVASFIIIYAIQIYAGITFGVYEYGIVLLIPVILSGVIALYISEAYGRKRHLNFVKTSALTITLGIMVVFTGIFFNLPFPIITLFLIPFYVGFSLYEISTIPALTSSIRKETYGSNIGFFYALQFAGNGLGAALGGAIGGLKLTGQSAILLGTLGLVAAATGSLIFIISQRFLNSLESPV